MEEGKKSREGERERNRWIGKEKLERKNRFLA